MSAFNEGLMTGAQLGQGAFRQRQAREVGGLMTSGNLTGARDAAYAQGDLSTGSALDTRVQAQEAQARAEGLTGALKTGDFEGAVSFARTPQELQAITAYRDGLTEAERATAARNAAGLASAIQSVQGLPPEQQLAAAQQAAAQFGIDPAKITPQSLTPQALDGLYIQAMGLSDFLKYKQDERAAQRPIIGNGFISLPPGSQLPSGGGQPEVLSALPPGARPRPRPSEPAPGQPVRATSERAQSPTVSFRSSNDARSAVAQIVPGVNVTNGDRTPADTARLRRQGYNPSDTSFHLAGQALDLTPPSGMTMAQLEQKMRQAGFRVLNEGHHIHVSW